MCYCIGKAATQVHEFHYLPVGDKLMEYDKLAINAIVLNKEDSINSCDIPYSGNLHWFKKELMLSFQFHHVQMEGAHASRFLHELQNAINDISKQII